MLVERGPQLAELGAVLARADGAGGGLGIISGGIGQGKTELLREIGQRAAAQGIRVLSASCSLVEQAIPYAVVDQLFRELALVGELPLMPPELRAARTSPEPSPQLLRFFHEIFTILTAQGPLLLTIDDIEHADEPSLRVLLYLYRRFQSVPASIIVAHGGLFGVDAFTPLGELLFQPRTRRVTVPALTAEGVRELIRRRTDGSWFSAVEILTLTNGNPALVDALLQDDEGQAATRSDAPQTAFGSALRHAALACLRRSGAMGLLVACAMAVLSPHASIELLSRLTELEVCTTRRLLENLSQSGILDEQGFHHPEIRTAVLDSLTPDTTVDLHRRAAVLLYDEGVPDLLLAEHLLLCGPVSEPWAVQVLVDASRQALREDQVTLALRCLKLAEECSVNETERLAINTALAAAVWRVRPEVTARKLTMLAESIRAGRLPAADSLALVPGMLWHGMQDVARAALRRHEDREAADPALDTVHLTTLLWVRATYPGIAVDYAETIDRLGREHAAAPDQHDNPARDAQRVLAGVLQGRPPEALVIVAEQVLQRVHLGDHSLETLTAAIAALLYAGRLGPAGQWSERLEEEAAQREASTWQALLSSLRSLVALRSGDLVTARSKAEAALRTMSPEGWGVGMGMPLSTAIQANIRIGDLAAAERLLAQPVHEQLLDTRFGLHYLDARARHHLAGHHPNPALADFLSCGERMRAWGLDCAALAPWRLGAAEAWLQMGNRERAAHMVDEQLALLDDRQPGTRGAALRMLARTRQAGQQPEILGQALELLQASGDRYELALVLTDLSHSHYRLGDPAKARIFARRAWRVGHGCGAEALCRSLIPPSGDAGSAEHSDPAGSEAVLSLTEAERRVGALAAEGHSNRDISAKLFITVSTVEQHLTRVYRKLGVRHRQDLPASLVFEEQNRDTA